MTSLELARKAATFLDSKKAEKLNVIEVDSISSLADYFVIASGGSLPHVRAMCDEVEEKLSKEDGIEPQRIEGYQTAAWILMDYGDVLVHLFQEDSRKFYSLERLWADAPRVELPGRETGA